MITNSMFLDMRQRSLVENLCEKRRKKGMDSDIKYCFFGGYEDAERTVAVFFPDYVQINFAEDFREIVEEAREFFSTEPEENPLVVLQINQNGYRELSHRDYLGSLTGLGIKREKIGDILVRSKDTLHAGADIIIMEDIAEFLVMNYEKAGRTYLKVEIKDVKNLIVPENRFEEFKDTVSSLRLDNVVSAAFKTSRGIAVEGITSGLVYVNGLQLAKPDKQVKEGDIIVLRGKGKAILQEVGGSTRKEKTYIIIRRYI